MRIILLLMLLVGCTKPPLAAESPVCKTIFTAVTGTAQVLSAALQCDNTPAIAGDISDQFAKLNLCAQATYAQGMLADVVCPQVSLVVSDLGKSAIPETWKCTATVVTELIKSKISEKCAKIINK